MKQPQYYDYNIKAAVPDKLFTPLHGVHLTDGLFRRVFDNNIGFTKRLDMDRMRYWFDVKRGITPTAERYPGHFEDNLKGQTASQYLMSAGNVLRWEEDEELRKGVDEIIGFLSDSAEDDGFLMPIEKTQFARKEYPHYVRIWLTYGLIAAARGGNPEAFSLLRRWQDWFNTCPDLPVIKYTELAFQGVVASPSVFFTEIGKPEDMKICREYYEETWRLAQFIGQEKDAVEVRRQHGREPHPHGSEIEAFEGYLDLYRYFGAPYLLNAVLGFEKMYREHWQHTGGGIVMIETFNNGNPLFPDSRYFRRKHNGASSSYNELCCTAFWLHLHQRLHRLFPDEERYVNEMEQSLYNVAIANQNGDVDIRYCAFLDEKKSEPVQLNHCCAGSGTRIFGQLPEYLYTVGPSTLSCDIYAPSVIDWQSEDQVVRVTQKTGFPLSGGVSLFFEMDQAEEFALRLRMPAYADGRTDILVNGQTAAAGEPGTYVVLRRIFRPGDTVTFQISMKWGVFPYSGIDKTKGYDRYSYTFGPLLMAVEGDRNHEEGIILPGRGSEFVSRLVPREKPLHFQIEGAPEFSMVPYYELQEESFTCFPMFSQ